MQDLPAGILPKGLPISIHLIKLLSSLPATWPAHLSLCDLIYLVISGNPVNFLYSAFCPPPLATFPISDWSTHSPQYAVLEYR